MSPTHGGIIKVYLLDDHDIVRQGLRDLLAPARDIRVVGDGGSARTAAASVLRLGADVMVLDLHLPDGSGTLVCREVRAADPSVLGLLVTSADDDEALEAVVLAGAAGAVVKLARSGDILTAVRALGAGRRLVDEATVARVSAVLRERAGDLDPAPTSDELALLDAVLDGLTDTDIAERHGRVRDEVSAAVAALVGRLTATAAGLRRTAPSS